MATKSPIDFGNIQGNSTISKGGNITQEQYEVWTKEIEEIRSMLAAYMHRLYN